MIKDISSSSMTLASAAEETAQSCEYNSQSLFEQQNGILQDMASTFKV